MRTPLKGIGTLSVRKTENQLDDPHLKMKTFDLFLVAKEGVQLDTESVTACLDKLPHVGQDPNDWTRFYYRNEESGTTFFLLVDPQFIPTPKVEYEEDEYPEGYYDDEDEPDEEDEPEEEDDDEEDDEEDEDGESAQIDTPPVTVNIPLFHPSFWAHEAFAAVRTIQDELGLDAIDPHDDGAGGGEPGDWSSEELFTSWLASHAEVYENLQDKELVQRWDAEKAERFSTYCQHRAALIDAHSPDGIAVPQLFTASHRGETKSLCIWRTDETVALPKCDLVLVQRVREKRGLLGRRKKIDELLVPGETIWKLLAPFASEHAMPAPVLVFTRAEDPPAQFLNDLDHLSGDHPDDAKRIPLGGIIDFEIPQLAPSTEDSPENTEESS